MAYETLLYDVAANGVATVTLNQPETRNALSSEVLGELIDAFESARDVRELAHGPAPAAPGSAGLAIVSRRNVRLSPRGFAAVALGCRSQAVDACQGLLGLHTAAPLRCGSVRRPAGFEIGATPFRIAVAPALVPVRLTAQGRRLADCAGRIRVRATVAAQPGARATAARTVEFTISAR